MTLMLLRYGADAGLTFLQTIEMVGVMAFARAPAVGACRVHAPVRAGRASFPAKVSGAVPQP